MAVVLVALAVLAWQQDGGGDRPLNAIAAAAERTQSEPGGRAAMRGFVSSPSGSYRIMGRMVFNGETDRARAVFTVPRTPSGGSVEMEMVVDGTVMYMRSSMFGSLPEGHEWMMLDLSLGGEVPFPTGGDAQGELALLEAATGGVRELGKEEVRGVPTTRYRGKIEASEQLKRLREEGQDDLATLVEEDATPLTMEVWIDADGLVRRTMLVKSEQGEGGEGPTTKDLRTDFFDLGISPEIDVPEEDEAFDATSLARESLDAANDE